jgi:excinuclease ABC subunit B
VEGSLSTQAHGYDSKARMVMQDSGQDFDLTETVRELEEEMIEASNKLEFEKAALLRDQIKELKRRMGGDTGAAPAKAVSYGGKKGKGRKR